MMDATASLDTAAMMSAGDTFNGTITNSEGDTEDWISIELEAGTTYTISVSGTLSGDDGGEMDTILTLYDSKGGMVDMNDDTKDSLGSMLEFTPEVDDTYYISVSTYRNNPNLDNSGTYMVSVTGMVVDLGVSMDIDGTERVVDPDFDTDPVIHYVSGNDKLTGTDAAENINGLSGDDSLYGMGGGDTLDGGRRDDMLYGGMGDDTLDGGDGDDTLEGGYGADMLTVGDDDDTAYYSMSMMGVTVLLHNGQTMGGDAMGDSWNLSETVEYTDGDEEMAEATVADIENLTGSTHADILTGDLRDNVIVGGGGNDKIYGGPSPADVDKETGGGLTNADTLHGDGGNDIILGGVGADTLKGGAGNDTLHGDSGADMLYGGAGSDMIYADTMDAVING